MDLEELGEVIDAEARKEEPKAVSSLLIGDLKITIRSTASPRGLERWSACCMAADSPPNQSARHPSNCIKSESEPNLNAD